MHILIASLIDWRTNTLIRWHHHQHQLLYNNITCRSHVALLLFSERLQPGSFLAVHPLFTPQLSCLVLFVSHTDYIPVGIALANDLFALTNKLQYVAQDPLIHVNSSCCFSLKGTENKNGYFVASQDRTLRSHLQKIPGNTLFHLILFLYSQFVSLTLYTLTSTSIFSLLFSIHFLRCWLGEFVQQSRVSLVGDNFLYSHDHKTWLRGDVVRRN